MRLDRHPEPRAGDPGSHSTALDALRVLPGYLPVLVFYGWLALDPHAFGHDQIIWLVLIQFSVIEMLACAVAVIVGFGLLRPSGVVPWYADPRDYPNGAKPRDPRQTRVALIGLGVALLLLAPAFVHESFGDRARTFGVFAAFLPRVLDAWQARDSHAESDPRLARALASHGLAGWGMALLCIAALWLVGSMSGPLRDDPEVPAWSSLAGTLIVSYYLGHAFLSVWMRRLLPAVAVH